MKSSKEFQYEKWLTLSKEYSKLDELEEAVFVAYKTNYEIRRSVMKTMITEVQELLLF